MTVNSRPLYRLSYRGVLGLSVPSLNYSRYTRVAARSRTDIITADRLYESIEIASLGNLGPSSQRLVLHLTHLFDSLGDELRREDACEP